MSKPSNIFAIKMLAAGVFALLVMICPAGHAEVTAQQQIILDRLGIELQAGEDFDAAMFRAKMELDRPLPVSEPVLRDSGTRPPTSSELAATAADSEVPVSEQAAVAGQQATDAMQAAMQFLQKAQAEQEAAIASGELSPEQIMEQAKAEAEREAAAKAANKPAPSARTNTHPRATSARLVPGASADAAAERRAAIKPVQTAQTTVEPVQITDVPAAANAAEGDFLVPEITNPDAELELTITLPEQVEIQTLIELVGKQLGLNYIYDQNKIKGDVMLKVHNGRIKVKDTYALLESVLKFRGFIMTRRGNLVTIVPRAEAEDLDPVIAESALDVRPGDVIVTRVFRLENVSTEVAKKMLASMKLGINIIDLPETKSMIVTGYSYRMPRIEKMFSLIDVPGEQRDFTYRRLEYTLASSVVSKINALASNLGTVSVTVSSDAAGGSTGSTAVRRDAKGRIIPSVPTRTQAAGAESTTIGGEAQGGVYIDVDDRTNRLLMIGSKDELEEVNKLIDAFDVPKQDLRAIKQYHIEFVGAEIILDALDQLGVVQSGGSQPSNSRSSRTLAAAARPTTAGAQASGEIQDAEEVLEDQPQVVYIETSNSLLVNATDEQHEKIMSIISYIDVEPNEDAAPVRVYPLENQSVEDISETLVNIVERIAKDKAESQGLAGTSGTTSTAGKVQKSSTTGSLGHNTEVTITGDESTNSIIVYASKKDQDWIANLITELDKKRPQVLIDVTLVEVTKNDDFNFSLKSAASRHDIATTTSGATSAPLVSGLENALDAGWNNSSLTGFYSDRNVQILLDTVQTKNLGRIMAKPKLLVNDNQEGEIKTSNTQYIASKSTSVIGEQGTTTSSNVSWDPYEAGVTLTITPHISEGDLLRLDVMLNRTDFQGTSGEVDGVIGPQDTVSTDITTTITVPDESTIILGGLTKINQSKGGNRVPLLSDIPLIGGLFKGTNNSDGQTRMYVFIKGTILRPDDTLRGLQDLLDESKKNRQSFEEFEGEFQLEQDWPGLDGKPMAPAKVLDLN
jgi:type II secretory pathway component GspD/PulD (secretin)